MVKYFPRLGGVIVSVILLLAFVPAYADSDVYTWKDENGVLTFSDDPTLAPEGIQARVWPLVSSGQNVSIIRWAEAAVKPRAKIMRGNKGEEDRAERFIPVVSQGAFAVQLVRELGLAQNISTEDAAQTLSEIRISPPLGDWALDSAMTPMLTTRLRTLSVSATQMGWLSITPEQALLAFDSAAALTGLPIPQITETENGDISTPAISVPPLVYIFPPPSDMISFYTWVPILSGFPFYGATLHGYYALHGSHLNAHHFNGHAFAFNAQSLQQYFVNHLPEHRNVAGEISPHLGRSDEHRNTAISHRSQRLRHRQNILNRSHDRQSHLRKSHRSHEAIRHLSRHERRSLRTHLSSSRSRPRHTQRHRVKKPHAISRRHTKSKILTPSLRHKTTASISHSGSGRHSSVSSGSHFR